MKPLDLIITVLTCCFLNFSQAQTSSWTMDIQGDDIVYNCIELDDGKSYACIVQSSSLVKDDKSTFLVILDSNSSYELVSVPDLQGPNNIYKDSASNSIIILGANKSNDSILSILGWTPGTNDFKTLNSVKLPGSLEFKVSLRNFYNHYYIVGSVLFEQVNYFNDPFFIELDSITDFLPNTYLFGLEFKPGTYAFDVVPYNQSEFLFSFRGFPIQPPSGLNELVLIDSGMVNKRPINFQERVYGISQFYKVNGQNYFSGRYRVIDTVIFKSSDDIVIGIVDTVTDSTMNVRLNHFGKKDTSDIEAYQNISGYQDHIYVGGSSDYDGTFKSHDTDFLVGKFDLDLNQTWERNIGLKNSNDLMWVVLATSDGGCLLGGSTYDYQNKNEQDRDLLFYKLDADGQLVTGNQQIEKESSSFKVFPNPATSDITLDVPDGESGEFHLFNNLGQQLEVWSVSGRVSKNLSRYSDGIYYYLFKSSDEKSYSGKFIIAK